MPRIKLTPVVAVILVLSVSYAFAEPSIVKRWERDQARARKRAAREDIAEAQREATRTKLRNTKRLRALKLSGSADSVEIEELDEDIARLRRKLGEESD
jgi:hypothetical protein